MLILVMLRNEASHILLKKNEFEILRSAQDDIKKQKNE